MVEGPMPSLSPLATRALEAEARRPDVDSALEARMFARLAGTLAVGAAAGAAAAAASGTASAVTTAGATTASATTAGVTAAGAAAASGAGAAGTAGAGVAIGLTVKTIPWIVVAFAAGGGAGAAIHARVVAPPSPAPIVAPAVPVAPPPLPVIAAPRDSSPAPSVSIAPPEPSRAAAPSAGAARIAAPGASPDVDLAAERALIDRARMAMARGQSDAALEALGAHSKAFPRGRLAEEREAIAVRALTQAGRTDEARVRADRFRATYPNSVFGAAVDALAPPK